VKVVTTNPSGSTKVFEDTRNNLSNLKQQDSFAGTASTNLIPHQVELHQNYTPLGKYRN
ncbi:hypothetical protein L9F63_025841, partial [Diploptera punctata]